MWFKKLLYRLTVKVFLKLCKAFNTDPNNDEEVANMGKTISWISVLFILVIEFTGLIVKYLL